MVIHHAAQVDVVRSCRSLQDARINVLMPSQLLENCWRYRWEVIYLHRRRYTEIRFTFPWTRPTLWYPSPLTGPKHTVEHYLRAYQDFMASALQSCAANVLSPPER